MKLFRIEKNTPNLELKKFKKGYYKAIATFDGITELEVFCKIDKKTSDYFYFKVEDKDLPSFKRLEELKMGYFVIPEQPGIGVVELQPESTIINFNNQKDEEPIMSNVNYTISDLDSVTEVTLNAALKSLKTKERIIEGVNTLPEEFLPQVEAVKATNVNDIEARVAVLTAMANFAFEDATVVEETVKESTETKVEEPTEKVETDNEKVDIEEVVEETKKMSKEELDERIQATRKTIAAAQEAANDGFSFTKTTLKVAVGTAVAYGLYKLVKKFI